MRKKRLTKYDFDEMKKSVWVYIVECEDGTLYTGMTCNVPERMLDHQNGRGSRYVCKHGFKRLAYVERVENRDLGSLREREIKDKGTKYRRYLVALFDRMCSFM